MLGFSIWNTLLVCKICIAHKFKHSRVGGTTQRNISANLRYQRTMQSTWVFLTFYIKTVLRTFRCSYFLANVNVLRYVCYMLSAVRLSSVCLSVCCLSVTLVHPTQAVELFGNFFHHTIAQGLYFSGAKNRWWGTSLSP